MHAVLAVAQIQLHLISEEQAERKSSKQGESFQIEIQTA